MIRGLLGLARGDEPVGGAHRTARAWSSGAVALVRHRLDSAGVRLTESIATALPAVIGDEKLLEQAVVNLLLNACDACRSVGGSIVVRAAEDDGDVTILVEDSGVGISRSRRRAGARAVLHDQGARGRVRTGPGHRARDRLEPSRDADARAHARRGERERRSGCRPRGSGHDREARRRLVVVDDNLEMARDLADGLADRGYDAVAARLGREAWQRLAAASASTRVVTDLRMPDVDGLQLLAHVARASIPTAR